MTENVLDNLEINRKRGTTYLTTSGKSVKHVYHCNFFNTFWQRTIENFQYRDLDEESYERGRNIIKDSVKEYILKDLRALFEDERRSHGARVKQAERFFTELAAIGNVELPTEVEDGEVIEVENSHFGTTWLDMFGEQDGTRCTYWEGALEAAVAVINVMDEEKVNVEETKCIAQGHDHCEFEVTFE